MVKLQALTAPVEPISADEFVAYCARVSNPANQHNHVTGGKLVKYLIRNQHWSPLEMVHAVMEIRTTRDIARQILRHRSFSFQEFSQRYAEAPGDMVQREARLQDTTNRQNSLETEDDSLSAWWADAQRNVGERAKTAYEQALARGIAKEVARAVLPEGLTMSRLYMAGSIRSWVHYIQLRTDPSTQKEHRIIAQQCRDELVKAMPSLDGDLMDSWADRWKQLGDKT